MLENINCKGEYRENDFHNEYRTKIEKMYNTGQYNVTVWSNFIRF